MRLLKNPTRKIKRRKKKTHTPQSHFQRSLFKKGINPSDSRRGAVGREEKLKGFRQPDSPGGRGGREGDMGWSSGWGGRGREGGRDRKEQRRGAIKTLTSNLVYCVKKSHMHSRPLRAHTAPRVATAGTSSRPRPFLPGLSGAVRALLLRRRRRDLRPVCWGHCRGRAGGQAVGQGTEHRNASFSNKKEKSSLYTVVCFGSVQTE